MNKIRNRGVVVCLRFCQIQKTGIGCSTQILVNLENREWLLTPMLKNEKTGSGCLAQILTNAENRERLFDCDFDKIRKPGVIVCRRF